MDCLATTPVLELAPVYPPLPSAITIWLSPSTTTPSPALGMYPSPSECHAPASAAASIIDGTYLGTSLPNVAFTLSANNLPQSVAQSPSAPNT